MDPDQVELGVWHFRVSTSNPKTGYVWSRVVSGKRVETYASTASDALWFDADTTLEVVSSTQSFSNRNEFLSWACTELGSEDPLTWWELTSDVQEGTWSCGAT